MPEEVLLESETVETRDDVAAYLRTVAGKLEGGEHVTLDSGADSVTLSVPERATFEVTVEREGPRGGPGEVSVEFEIEWEERGGDGGGISIE